LISFCERLRRQRLKKRVILKRGEEERILSGHQWVFSNEIKEVQGSPESGDLTSLSRHDGKFLGVGFYNPHSLIAFRLLTTDEEEIGFDFFKKRILKAHELRQRLSPRSDMCRLVHGESDFLPGLVIDRYRNYFSLQAYSAGMDRRLTLISDVLESLFRVEGIVERNEGPLRTLEGLPERKGILRGTVGRCTVSEHDIVYDINLLEGQKTGFYLDQRENRKAIRRFAHGASVLDCFCNDGGFGLNAAAAGARTVVGVDISEEAAARATKNAAENGFENVCAFRVGNAFEVLKEHVERKAKYNLIVLDPPSFTRSKKNLFTAKRGYREINMAAMRLLSDGGILATSSCSHHVTDEMFLEVVSQSAVSACRKAQLLEWRGAAPDHPVLPAMPETKYLKFGLFTIQ
jgi:23S rRNA (cytosine1962-C5)-methyltransferase